MNHDQEPIATEVWGFDSGRSAQRPPIKSDCRRPSAQGAAWLSRARSKPILIPPEGILRAFLLSGSLEPRGNPPAAPSIAGGRKETKYR